MVSDSDFEHNHDADGQGAYCLGAVGNDFSLDRPFNIRLGQITRQVPCTMPQRSWRCREGYPRDVYRPLSCRETRNVRKSSGTAPPAI